MIGFDEADERSLLGTPTEHPVYDGYAALKMAAAAVSLLGVLGICLTAPLQAQALPTLVHGGDEQAQSWASGRYGLWNRSTFESMLRAENVPSACDPKPVDSICNPMSASCEMPSNATAFDQLVSKCLVGGALAFCGYAGMDTTGYPSESGGGAGPVCPLTKARVAFAQPPNPATALAEFVGSDFVCFNSSKNSWDRLCISRGWIRSIDCLGPGESRAKFLAKILSAGEADYRMTHNGKAPQFQCFHRGGFGSVPWLHLHSFVGYADSICPEMSTVEGWSPNPLPHQIVCSNGERSVRDRVQQMLDVLETSPPGYGDVLQDGEIPGIEVLKA